MLDIKFNVAKFSRTEQGPALPGGGQGRVLKRALRFCELVPPVCSGSGALAAYDVG
jgi:hypothetical protein